MTGSTWNRPRKGQSKRLSLRAKTRRMSPARISLEVAEADGRPVSAQTIHHTLQVVLPGRCPRRKPLLKLADKKTSKQFAESNLSKSMNYWIMAGLWQC